MTDTKPDIRIATINDPNWTVVVFQGANGGADAIITSPDSPKKPMCLSIDPPPPGTRIVTTRYPDGTVELVYRSTS
jgi:hypothetical protein